MRGEIVLVRAFGGKPLKRRVWDVGAGVVYITNDEQFQNLITGRRSIKPVGFPPEDVFKDSDDEMPETGSVDWSRLVPWQTPTAKAQRSIRTHQRRVHPAQESLCFEPTNWKQSDRSDGQQLSIFSIKGSGHANSAF